MENLYAYQERNLIDRLKRYREQSQIDPEFYEPKVAYILNELGNLHYGGKDYRQAEEDYVEALEIYRRLSRINFADYGQEFADILCKLGKLHQDIGNYQIAESKYTEAITLYQELETRFPNIYIQNVAKALNGLASLYCDTHNYKQALKEYVQVLDIHKELTIKDYDKFSPHLAITLSSIGSLCFKTRDYVQAEKVYLEALEIYRKLAYSNAETYNSYVAQTLNNLGNIHYSTNEYNQASDEYTEALDIYHKLIAKYHTTYDYELATTLNNLGCLHFSTNKYAQAIAEYDEALLLYRRMPQQNPDTYQKVADIIKKQGTLYSKMGNYDKAFRKFEEAMDILKTLVHSTDNGPLQVILKNQFNQTSTLESSLKEERYIHELEQSLEHCKSIQLRLNRLSIKNLRLFGNDEQYIDFDHSKNITIILGNNGAGKTSLLYACNVIMTHYLTDFYPTSTKNFVVGDVRIINSVKQADYLSTNLSLTAIESNQSVSLYQKGETETPHSDVLFLRSLSNIVRQKLTRMDVVAIPILAYYSTERGHIAEMEEQNEHNHVFPRWHCYENALEANTNFSHLFNWFKRMEDEELRNGKEYNDLNYQKPELQAIRKALDNMNLHLKNPRVKGFPLRFVMDDISDPENPKELRIDQMSDGYRIMIAMIADIASRMAEANPSFECSGLKDPLQTPGVVFIDEVDLHLHPKWQRNVLHQLHKIFPNVQFIVTTHSPSVVLGAIDIAQVVRLDNGVIDTDLNLEDFQYDDISRLLLSELFGLDSVRSRQYEVDSKRRNELIDKDHLTSKEKDELDRLDKEMDKYDPSGVDDIKSILNILGERE